MTNFTTDRAFIDTNILVYAFDQAQAEKRKIASALIEHAFAHSYWISAQVLHEFYVNVTRKVVPPLDAATAKQHVMALSHLKHADNLVEDISPALDLMAERKLNFWDALIVHTAIKLSCRVIYTEDMAAGEEFGATRIVNPFS